MSMRIIRLPDDLPLIAWVIEDLCWYAPEDPWELRTEEVLALRDSFRNLKTAWGLLRVLRGFSSSLGDIVRGHLWEEGKDVVGFSAARRVGSSGTWRLSGVGVLPEERRKGIGSALMKATLDLVRSRGGEAIVADIRQENTPAIGLMQSLGFEGYSQGRELIYESRESIHAPSAPGGYLLEPIGAFDWKPRLAFEKRILPAEIQRYEPVDEGRFRKPFIARALRPLVQLRGSARDSGFVVRDQTSGDIVAEGRAFAKGRSSETSEIMAGWDPEATAVAPFLVQSLLHEAQRFRPGCPVEFTVPAWMDPLAHAALDLGFEERISRIRFGKLLVESEAEQPV